MVKSSENTRRHDVAPVGTVVVVVGLIVVEVEVVVVVVVVGRTVVVGLTVVEVDVVGALVLVTGLDEVVVVLVVDVGTPIVVVVGRCGLLPRSHFRSRSAAGLANAVDTPAVMTARQAKATAVKRCDMELGFP